MLLKHGQRKPYLCFFCSKEDQDQIRAWRAHLWFFLQPHQQPFQGNRRKKNLLGAVTTHVCETIQLCIKTYLVVIFLVVSVVVICAKGYSIVGTNVTCERKTNQLWTLSL